MIVFDLRSQSIWSEQINHFYARRYLVTLRHRTCHWRPKLKDPPGQPTWPFCDQKWGGLNLFIQNVFSLNQKNWSLSYKNLWPNISLYQIRRFQSIDSTWSDRNVPSVTSICTGLIGMPMRQLPRPACACQSIVLAQVDWAKANLVTGVEMRKWWMLKASKITFHLGWLILEIFTRGCEVNVAFCFSQTRIHRTLSNTFIGFGDQSTMELWHYGEKHTVLFWYFFKGVLISFNF